MKAMTRAAGLLASPGAALSGAVRAGGLTLVGWHRIGARDGGLSTTFADFCRHLDVLEDWGASVLPLDEAARLLVEGGLPERAVALTFDDGYASVLEQAWPELRRRGLPATMFAVSGYLDDVRRFPWDHGAGADADTRVAGAAEVVAAAAEGLDIGSHTVTHRWLPHLDRAERREELVRSRKELEDLLGRAVTSFAYPMGGWNADVRDDVEEAGYRLGITVERGRNGAAHDPLALRRWFAFDRAVDFRRQLAGAYDWMRPIERRRTRGGPR